MPRKPSAARNLAPADRRALSIQALAGRKPLAHLARQYQVSRKFVYHQTAKASAVLDEAFADPTASDEREGHFGSWTLAPVCSIARGVALPSTIR